MPTSYHECLQRAERITWRVEDLIGGDKAFDFSRRFLPDTLARCAGIEFLRPRDRLLLNQIRAHAYLSMFLLVEEFVLPFVLDHARPISAEDHIRLRAYLEFAAEEAKHIHLFRSFREAFSEGFGRRCMIIGPSSEIARRVLSHPKLSVALLMLHMECMTQSHYFDCAVNDRDIDERFSDLLLHHALEEQQHAQLDALMIETMAGAMRQDDIDTAIQGYLELTEFMDGALLSQVRLDIAELEEASGRRLGSTHRELLTTLQHQACRWTFLGSGMRRPQFLACVERLNGRARAAIETRATAYC